MPAIVETDEANNTWQRQFCWEASQTPPPAGTPVPPTMANRLFLPFVRSSVCGGVVTTAWR